MSPSNYTDDTLFQQADADHLGPLLGRVLVYTCNNVVVAA